MGHSNLEFEGLPQDCLASLECLVANIKGARFKVSCNIKRIEVEVSLHVPLAEYRGTSHSSFGIKGTCS